ncbi:MAG: hypothetical protein LBK65_03210 [Tannerellaceae bacterium]|nr:hypothetical protein [Tannerellaceae bacterium]
MKTFVTTLICICLILICREKTSAVNSSNDQHNIDVNELTGNWVFEKIEIFGSQANAQNHAVKTTIERIPDLQPYSSCFYHAILGLFFISEDRLIFERYDTSSMGETEYRLIPGEGGAALLEIFILREEEDIPVPIGGPEYQISQEGTDRLKITTDATCFSGEVMTCYLKRM